MPKPNGPWRSFLSLSTLVTGAVTAAVFASWWTWTAGVLLVLLLYLHEVGHVLAALWRRVPIQRAPLFIPGLGAFVILGATPRPWDSVAVSLGGPVIGTVAAVLFKVIGLRTGWHTLAIVGNFAVWINLTNLLPLLPMDGGWLLSLTGWMGLVVAVLAGGGLFLLKAPWVLLLVAVYGIWQAYRSAKQGAGRSTGWGARFGIFGIYVLTLILLLVAAVLSGSAASINSLRDHGSMVSGNLFMYILIAYWISQTANSYAWKPGVSPGQRYPLLALAGWPYYLLVNPWQVPVMAFLAIQSYGGRGAVPLERLIRYLARRKNETAGYAAAMGYEFLWSQGDREGAERWLETLLPTLQERGLVIPLAMQLNALRLMQRSDQVLLLAADLEYDPTAMTPLMANNLAWALHTHGRAQQGLPYARAAVAGMPEQPSFLDTLGQILLATGAVAEAIPRLRLALSVQNRPGTRVALARALAAQGQYAEAIAEAERAIRDQTDPWPNDEPGPDQIRLWLDEWRSPAPSAIAEG